MTHYDYIVAGGGSAGCVLAARLSEDAATRVLLIESGRRDKDPFIHIPATFFRVAAKGRDVAVVASEPERGLNDQSMMVPQGHVLGGGSSVNAMVYIRGTRSDYDHWAQLGCRNWSYEKVLPIFRDQESNQRLADAFHGTRGSLRVSDRSFGHPLSWAFIRAAQEAGFSYNEDFNGAHQEGVGFFQATTRSGRRCSAAAAFLRAAEKRQNLAIRTSARVARVLFSGQRAVGVELESGEAVKASREVILTAGAFSTPKILMLSGVGPAGHLRGLGIDVVADLPGVGQNFQDHLKATVQAKIKHPLSLWGEDRGLKGARHLAQYLLTRSGLLTSTVVESGGFFDSSGRGEPDIQFHVVPSLLPLNPTNPVDAHGISLEPCILRPQSRGSLRLRSIDPRSPLHFAAGSLSIQEDVDALARGVRIAIDILRQPSLATMTSRRILPKPGVEDDPEALQNYVRDAARTVFHPAGTCKMGPGSDLNSVVTEDLRVRGVDGLRVADASIMPQLVSGNTNAPTMMIAERAARFILGIENLAVA